MLAKWKHEKTYFDNGVTCDKSWVYHYDPKMKQQSMCWVKKESALRKKVHAQKFKLKIMMITFWDAWGIVYMYYYLAGQTVNMAYYKKVIVMGKVSILIDIGKYR